MSTTERYGYRYTPLFCEENIWHLAQSLINSGTPAELLDVVFISNLQQQVVMFDQQKAAPSEPILWDYHAILIVRHDSSLINSSSDDDTLVYDFETRLSFPCLLTEYLPKSFYQQQLIKPVFRALFRCLPAAEFIRCFSSDRSHMTEIIAPEKFPDYPPITSADSSCQQDLQQLIDFKLAAATELLDIDTLKQRYQPAND